MSGIGVVQDAARKRHKTASSRLTVARYLRISDEDADMKQAEKTESDSISNQRNLLTDFISRTPDFEDADIIEFCEM